MAVSNPNSPPQQVPHPYWSAPPSATLGASGNSLAQQLLVASTNLAFIGHCKNQKIDDSALRWPWYYQPVPSDLVEDLCIQSGLDRKRLAALISTPVNLTAGNVLAWPVALIDFLKGLDLPATQILATGFPGAIHMAESNKFSPVYERDICVPWISEESSYGLIFRDLQWLSQNGFEPVPSPNASLVVVATAPLAAFRPDALVEESPAPKRSENAILKSGLLCVDGELEVRAQEQRRFEVLEHLGQVVSKRKTRERWDHKGPNELRQLMVGFLGQPDHLSLQRAMAKAHAMQEKGRTWERRRDLYPVVWDETWGTRPVTMLNQLREAGLKGITGIDLKTLLNHAPSRVVSEMLRSTNQQKNGVAKAIQELRRKHGKDRYYLYPPAANPDG